MTGVAAFLNTNAVFLVGILAALLALVIVLAGFILAGQAREKRGREAFEETFIAALERRTHETAAGLAVQVNGVRSDVLASCERMNDTQNRTAQFLSDTLARSQAFAAERDRSLQTELRQTLEGLTRTQNEGLSAVARSMSTFQEEARREARTLNDTNARALEAMRATVEEKLQETLATRLTASFKTVEDQLSAVHRGLGEMREMASNVEGLRRVLTNVKTRGTFGEVQLGMILEELLTPEQYAVNVATRPKSSERVEFAVKLPGRTTGETVWLPIDAKFPLEDYERLTQATEAGDAAAAEAARKALYNRILLEARKIHEKYVEVPYTTEFAVLYLPAESLWAEVLKCPGLMERIQREVRVTVAGPTVLAALINSLQMGFRTLAVEEKSAEVWRLLAVVKTEFERFNEAVAKVEKRIEGVTGDLTKLRTRTNVMNRRLRDLNAGEADAAALPESKAKDVSDTVHDDDLDGRDNY